MSTFRARQMRPRHDTIRVMATHYSLTPSQVIQIIKVAGVPVIRQQDGFKGKLVKIGVRDVQPGVRMTKSYVTGWADGKDVDPYRTKLTRKAIMAVTNWAIRQRSGANN